MQVQVNSDNSVDINDGFKTAVGAQIKKSFARFDGRLTRVELHFNDLNGDKGGTVDKRCLLEVRPAGLDPVVVTNRGATVDEAYKGAIRKMTRKLSTIFGRAEKMVADPAAGVR